MKKLIIGVMALMLILTGCSSSAKPEDTVDTFFTAVKGFDLEKAAKTLSPEAIDELEEKFNEVAEDLIEDEDGEDVEDIDYTSLEGFTEAKAVIQGYLGKLEYKVGEATITGDNKELATVVVNVSYIDAGEVFTNTFGEMFGRIIGMAFTGQEPSETEISEIALEMFNEQAEEYKEARASKDITLNLTKIEDKWFIDELDEEAINVLLFGIQDAFDSWGDGLFGNSDLDNDEDNSRAISIKAITNSGTNNYTVFEENIHTVDELFKKLEEENWFSIQLDSKQTAEKYAAKETFVLYVTSSTCPACQIYDEVYDDVSKQYQDVMYKIDYQAEVSKNEEAFTNLVVDHLGYIDATPTTIFIVDGQVVSRFVGIMKYSDLENSIKNYKISK